MKIKKKLGIVYIVVIMVIFLIPFAGMTFFATNSTTENKTLAPMPSLVTDDGFNMKFFDELGTYFEDHFAFREYMVNADALIQSQVFHVSNVDTVVTGEDGWLYYDATVDNYLGQNLMSDRDAYQAAHNLSLMQDYVQGQGARFVVAISPNKNSLYGEHMPYYDSYKASEEKNAEKVQAQMEAQEVAYVDLFDLFQSQDEVLYLKRDSHWNGKGAVLVYNELLSALGVEHDPLDTVPVTRTKTEIGDLNSMIYPLSAQPEWNYYYQYDPAYTYVTDTESVEDGWIETENKEQEGSLLMFRDSFGNSLLPLMANAVGSGYFSKGVPAAIQTYMETYEPEMVIDELVERNIEQFITDPPVMQGPEVEEAQEEETKEETKEKKKKKEKETDKDEAAEEKADEEDAEGEEDDQEEAAEEEAEKEDAAEDTATLLAAEADADTSYWCLSGILDPETAAEETNVQIRLSDGDAQQTLEAFLTKTQDSDYGYMLYVKKDYLTENFSGHENELKVEVMRELDGKQTTVHTETIDFTGIVAEDEE